MKALLKKGVLALFAVTCFASNVSADDTIRVASAQRGLWDVTLIEFGKEKGIYKDHGIDIDLLWTDGGANQQQAVIGGSIDIAFGTGGLGAVSAYAKGAPIEILSSHMTGASDFFWYVKGDSPIKSFKDTDGKTVAFSRPGSSTNLVAEGIVKGAGTSAKLVPAGGPAASMTQVLSGQIDVGWSAVPIGFDRVNSGEIRIIGDGNMSPGVEAQTVRVLFANRNFLNDNRELVERFMKAHKEVLDWAYTTDEALEMWAKMREIDLSVAKKARDMGYPRSAMQMFPIKGIDMTIAQAIQYERLDKPLSEEEKEKMLAVSVEMSSVVQ